MTDTKPKSERYIRMRKMMGEVLKDEQNKNKLWTKAFGFYHDHSDIEHSMDNVVFAVNPGKKRIQRIAESEKIKRILTDKVSIEKPADRKKKFDEEYTAFFEKYGFGDHIKAFHEFADD